MPHKKPQPLRPVVPRKRCPVCGELSYSKAGLHPQCSQVRSEPARLRRIERHVPATPPSSKEDRMRRWDKTCPRCGMRIHVRKQTCGCGHDFST